ncbi:MAG: hypothetical protein AB7F50_00295 [Fimbriimonadaceae bacterium]
MSAVELFTKQCDVASHQLSMCLKGMHETLADGKSPAHAMSPRETVVHLTECYVALQRRLKGEEHEWGSYESPGGNLVDLVANMFAVRDKAVAAALAEPSDENLLTASDFLTIHDAYHVGQLASYRMGAEPSWDAYSLYA